MTMTKSFSKKFKYENGIATGSILDVMKVARDLPKWGWHLKGEIRITENSRVIMDSSNFTFRVG